MYQKRNYCLYNAHELPSKLMSYLPTTQEVAEKLAVTVGTVNNLSAYRKGEYGVGEK